MMMMIILDLAAQPKPFDVEERCRMLEADIDRLKAQRSTLAQRIFGKLAKDLKKQLDEDTQRRYSGHEVMELVTCRMLSLLKN